MFDAIMMFSEQIKKEFGLDVTNSLTISSLAMKHQKEKGCFYGVY